jgi:hypothetical protein
MATSRNLKQRGVPGSELPQDSDSGFTALVGTPIGHVNTQNSGEVNESGKLSMKACSSFSFAWAGSHAKPRTSKSSAPAAHVAIS